MSRDELIVVVARQAEQLAQLVEANEALAGKLARLEHLLSRNSGNSSSPPSRDDDPGKPAPPEKQRGRGGPERSRGKQPGAPGSHLAWTDDPDERRDRFPEGRCDCGDDLAGARGSGRGRPLPAARDPAGRGHGSPSTTSTGSSAGAGAATPPPDPTGPGPGPVGYGPNLAAFAVYLMVVHFVPAHRVVALLESLTGDRPLGRVRARHARPHRRAARRGPPADPRP